VNVALRIVAAVLTAVFLAAGAMKLTARQARPCAEVPLVAKATPRQVKAI